MYREASVIGCATSRPSRVVAAHRQITLDWLAVRASMCDRFVAQLVATEAAVGDESAARQRTALLDSASGQPFWMDRASGGAEGE